MVPGESVSEHFPAELQMRLDHLALREPPRASSGEAIGDGEQGDVGRHRLARHQVVVDRHAGGERALVDQEANRR